MSVALLDRHVTRIEGEEASRGRISDYRAEARYVLLGEPGIGKSTVFEREASLAGTTPIRAHEFARGTKPPGRILFIDALEEYRIGEAGIDRLLTLIEALKASDYAQWRIACRAISLPPPDASRLARALGDFKTLQLELLDPVERRSLLTALGEANPAAFITRVSALGADPLLGNPATLILLRETFRRSHVLLDTREALFAEATRQMSHELNPEMPDRPDRPSPALIEAAAEAACLVLLLSVRSDIWPYSLLPPHASVVTRDDLMAGGIDTEALRAAVGTAMFKGDPAGFQPTHRVIAEYLAGRALARAVAPSDPRTPALPILRALALLAGDNDKPTPALTGVFAWFATMLGKAGLSERVVPMIKSDPEAVLLQGDAAALPTGLRQLLLESVGRSDPWFLGAARGSSAIGGLAGDDLVSSMREILSSPAESRHRQQMVLEALATGRRVPALAPDIRAIITTPSPDHYRRRSALDAYLHIEGCDTGIVRKLFDDIAAEPSATASEVRAELAALLVREKAISAVEVCDLIVGYARTGERTMGYAHSLGDALVANPMPALFDAEIDVSDQKGVTRVFEVRALLHRALAAAIATTPGLTAERMLSWLGHVGVDDHDKVEDKIQDAIAGWVDRTADGERLLVDALHAAILEGTDRLWRVDIDFSRFTGREISDPLRQDKIDAVASAQDHALEEAARLAFFLLQPFEKHAPLYWRLFDILSQRPLAKDWYDRLILAEIEPWRKKHAQERAESSRHSTAISENDREWMTARINRLRDGSLSDALGHASDVYFGYRPKGPDAKEGPERIARWLENDATLIDAIREGWESLIGASLTTPREEGQAAAFGRWSTSELMVVAWADWRLRDGLPLNLSLPLAFRLLRYTYDANMSDLRAAALERVYTDPNGTMALIAYWAGALRIRGDYLPEAQHLDPQQIVVRGAVLKILRRKRGLQEPVLRDLFELAAQYFDRDALLRLATDIFARSSSGANRRFLALVLFLLKPAQHAQFLESELANAEGDELFARLWSGRFNMFVQLSNDQIVPRSEAIVRHLGPRHGPPRISDGDIARLGEVVANAVVALSQEVTDDAEKAMDRLIATPNLAAWKETVEHRREEQRTAVRIARFSPPAPAVVARALAAGPPATPADLRAVIHATLDDLASDIRTSDTSSWRGFWNRPYRRPARPRQENDCRDLLTDRLRDRLQRYGIPVNRISTETRSISDRRADMLILGDGAAAVPIEAKRHWNTELWTAITDQLHTYARSAGSNGHGIYLIFWFGLASDRRLPTLPGGGAAPTTPAELKSALESRLEADDRGKIEIMVLDLSEPPATKQPKAAKSGARKPASKPSATSPKPRTKTKRVVRRV